MLSCSCISHYPFLSFRFWILCLLFIVSVVKPILDSEFTCTRLARNKLVASTAALHACCLTCPRVPSLFMVQYTLQVLFCAGPLYRVGLAGIRGQRRGKALIKHRSTYTCVCVCVSLNPKPGGCGRPWGP